MNANELRIGNLVNYEQTTHKITSLSEDHCMSVWFSDSPFEDDYVHNYSELKPIPLTEEWLIKFGFIFIKGVLKLQLKEDTYIKGLISNDKVFNVAISETFEGMVTDCISLKSIIYVHQLQNLYFALTNDELTIK